MCKFLLNKNLTFLFFMLLVVTAGFSQARKGVFDPFDYGAKGDGKTLDTKALQSAIDKCNATGGGKVYLHSGCFVSGTIRLKDNVTLEVESGTILKASNNLEDFPTVPSKYPSYTGEMVTNKALLYAEEVRNITICGRGTIDGNGDYWIEGPYGSPSFSVRPRIIHFRNCNNVRVCDVTLYNSASWVQSYQSCCNLAIDGIAVNSRPNKDIEKPRFEDARGRNCDGLDLVDCQQVRISNCNINSGDDAICLKSFSPDETCQDITITNCVVSSNASGIKIGTETAGGFYDITVQNCVVYDTRGDAIGIMTVDGARIERINISDISLRNIKGTAVFIKMGNRNRPYRKNAEINTPCLKNISVKNIHGTSISSSYCCSVGGMASLPIENIAIRDINLRFVGGKEIESSPTKVPEREDSYPNGRMYGGLPAYGFFVRHAKNITFENIALSFEHEDQRPALRCDNVDQLEIKNFKAPGSPHTSELIRMVNSQNIIILESRPTSIVPVFVSLNGDKMGNLLLINNFLQQAEKNIAFEKETMKSLVTEAGTIK